jgi:GTP-binding protein
MIIKSAAYVQSCPTLAGCPATDKPEFAFIGRSNVGKSSVINLITNRKSLALISVSPGKTRNINHFIINDSWYLVDLPGYGYAKVSRDQRDLWQENLEEYLKKRENLITVFLLVDSNVPPQAKDIAFTNWLGENEIPFSIIFTKTDKPKVLALNENINTFMKELSKTWVQLPPHFLTSANKKVGRDELLDYIEECITNREG